MKSQFFLLSLSASGVFAQTITSRKAEYDSICSNKNGLTEEILPDYWVRYNCERLGNWNSPAIKGVQDARACAQECMNVDGCEGSSWSADKAQCLLSGARAGKHLEYVLFMERTEADDPFPIPADGDETIDCEEARDELQAEVENCKSTQSSLQAQLNTCKKSQTATDPAWERRKEAMEICGYGGRTKIQAGKFAYTPRCQRLAATGAFNKELQLSVDRCLQECTKDKKCKSVNYVIMNDAPCKLYERGATSAVLVTEEGSCSRSPMIGFTPTTAK
jgi:hypothetical protein